MMIESKFGNVKAFSEVVDVPYTTIRTILANGVGKAGVDNVLKICQGLGIDPKQLSDDFKIDEVSANTMALILSLEVQRKVKVYNFTKHQLEEQNNITHVDFVNENSKTIVTNRRTAAGSALHVDDSDARREVVSSALIPKGADELVEVVGRSMEPLIRNGQEVYMRYQPVVENGEIAIVRIENEGVTCKRVYFDNGTITLKSENEEYDEMHFDASQIVILGKVLL